MIKISFLMRIGFFLSFFAFFSACNRDDLNEMKSIRLTLVSNYIEQPIDNEFIFKVEGDNLTDITNTAQLKVNGVLISGNSFTPSSEGNYVVQAFYEDFASKTITVKAITPSDYTQKVLVEDYTGTWCGWCPRVAYALQQCKLQSTKIVSVAIHISSGGEPDPYQCDGGVALKNEFGISGLPKARINRIHTWTANEQNNLNEVLNKTGYNAPLGLAIETDINNSIVETQIRVGFANNYNDQLNLIVYVVENGLIYDQTNYTTFFGGNSTLVNFVHNDVLRSVVTPILGEPIPASETTNGHIFTKNLNITIPSSVSNYNNLMLVAFVVKASTKEVINVQEVAVGSEIGFE